MVAIWFFLGMSLGSFFGFIVAACLSNSREPTSHVKIGDVWHEVDKHGRMVVNPEDKA